MPIFLRVFGYKNEDKEEQVFILTTNPWETAESKIPLPSDGWVFINTWSWDLDTMEEAWIIGREIYKVLNVASGGETTIMEIEEYNADSKSDS